MQKATPSRRGIQPGLLILLLIIAPALRAQLPPVPAEYQDLYSAMQSSITSFAQTIPVTPVGSRPPVAFSAHIASANSSSGPGLLDPDRMTTVQLEIDGVKAVGGAAISLSIDYPTLDPAFDAFGGQSANYLAFYKSVVGAARARGLKVIIETGPLFSDPVLSQVNVMPFYQTQTVEAYGAGRAAQAVLIARELAPDYLSVIQEPDTEAAQTGKSELGTPDGSSALLNQIMAVYRSSGATVPVGAGVGSWIVLWDSYIQKFLTTTVDFIDIHVYPSNRDYLPRAQAIADMAHAAGRKAAISETWLNKVRDSELGILSSAAIFARDVYSFWTPLDTLFLNTMADLAFAEDLVFVGAFQGGCFRGYLDYSPSTASLDYTTLNSMVHQIQSSNMMGGVYTTTSRGWENHILPVPDTSAPGTVSAAPTPYPTSVQLTWGTPADNVGVGGYVVFRNGVQIGQTGLTAWYDTGLTDGTKYTYSVSAFDVAGNTSPAANVQVQTKDVTPPAAPANFKVTLTSATQIDLQWTAAQDNVGVVSYWIKRGVDGAAPTALANLGATATTYRNSAVQSSTRFCYNVVAMDAAGMASAPTPTLCVTTPDTTPPTVPTGVTATAVSSTQVNVGWSASTDKIGVTAYKVYRSVNGGTLTLLTTTSSTPGYTDRSTTAKTTYNYRISACDAGGNCSAQSAGGLVTTPALPDSAAPKVTVSAPRAGATVRGTASFSATASDPAVAGQTASGVAGVRFLVDGLDIAAELKTAPYTLSFNTKTLANGSHTVTAIARDGAGNTATSGAVSVTVKN